MQAARAADYAIQQFKDLDRLLLHHGRTSYFRLATMCTFFFYKSWVFTLPQWMFGWFCARSGQTFYEAIYVPSFNMFFSSAPVFFRALIDKDVPDELAYPLAPELYHVGQQNLLFGFSALSHDFSLSIVHAFAVFFLVLFALAKEEQELWTMSLTTYSAVVVVVTIRIAVGTRTWTLANVIAYIGSLGLFIFWLYFYDRISADPTIRGVAPRLLGEVGKLWPIVLIVAGTGISSEISVKMQQECAEPTNVERVRRATLEVCSLALSLIGTEVELLSALRTRKTKKACIPSQDVSMKAAECHAIAVAKTGMRPMVNKILFHIELKFVALCTMNFPV